MKKSKMVLRDNHYYKYVCIWDNETQKKKQIPFKLAHKNEYEIANFRKGIVEQREAQFKRDNQQHLLIGYQFDWETDSGVEEVKKPLSLQEGADLYLAKMLKLRRANTLEMYLSSLKHIIDFLGEKTICSEVNSRCLFDYVIKKKGSRSDTSINMDLRILRTMLYHCRDLEGLTLHKDLSFKIALKECPVNDTEPIYISEVEFKKIMSEDWCLLYVEKREWYKEVYQLYWDLGIRLSEGFKGTLKNNYLEIPEEVAKNGVLRKVFLTPAQARTIRKMQEMWIAKGRSKWHIREYSKVFKKALRHCGIDDAKHFHCLRHSFGVRRRIETNGNVLKIQAEMGHKHIDSTQKYIKCDDRQLKYDFPSYRKSLELLEKKAKSGTSTKKTSTNYAFSSYSNSRGIS